MGVWGQGGTTDFQGYDYVQTAQPAEPTEGQTWYDLDADSALVYDGANWVEMTVTDHGQLSGVTTDAHHAKTTQHSELSGITSDAHHARYTDSEAQTVASNEVSTHAGDVDAHHARYTDSEAIQATDGVIDAETVDGKHASDLATPANTQYAATETAWYEFAADASTGGTTTHPYVPCDGLRGSGATFDSVSVELADGRSFTINTEGNSTTFPPGIAVAVSTSSTDGTYGTVSAELRVAAVHSHQHSLP